MDAAGGDALSAASVPRRRQEGTVSLPPRHLHPAASITLPGAGGGGREREMQRGGESGIGGKERKIKGGTFTVETRCSPHGLRGQLEPKTT